MERIIGVLRDCKIFEFAWSEFHSVAMEIFQEGMIWGSVMVFVDQGLIVAVCD